MATYTPNLNLFEPGTDPDMVVEDTLRDNFVNIDTKLGDALTDAQGTKWNTLGTRLNDSETKLDQASSDVDKLKSRIPNALLSYRLFSVISNAGIDSCPPNTEIGYRYAVEWGYYGVLGHIQRTSDGYWVMYDAADLSTRTNGTGAVSSKTLAQIQALDCGSSFNSTYWAGEVIPTIDDYLRVLRSTQSVPFIRLVGTSYTDLQIQEIYSKLKDWGMINDAVVICTDTNMMNKFRLYTKELAVGLYVSTHSTTTLDTVAGMENAFVVYQSDIATATNMADVHARGLVCVVYMLGSDDTNAKIREMAQLGVRGVITNVPAIRGV